jgi:hypothetical protein
MKDNRERRTLLRSCAIAFATLGMFVAACDHASPSDPAPPSGGRTYVLAYDSFASSVEPVLSGLGCDNLNCHGGGIRGTFQLSPPNAKDTHYDFDQACLQVTPADLKTSPLLMKPLAEECGGASHGGGAFFFALDDPNYVALLQWVESGEFQ